MSAFSIMNMIDSGKKRRDEILGEAMGGDRRRDEGGVAGTVAKRVLTEQVRQSDRTRDEMLKKLRDMGML